MKIIAICTNIGELDAGAFEDRIACDKWPGSAWIHSLHKLSIFEKFKVVGGDYARYLVQTGAARASEVWVIQEECAHNGEWLMSQGANGFMLMCFESPIFTPKFYDKFHDLKKRFKYSMCFEGGTFHLKFPSFDNKEVMALVPWKDRKLLTTVTSNKHYSMLPQIDSRTFKEAVQFNLHDKRYAFMAYFKTKGLMDIYGKGWHSNFGTMIPDGQKNDVISKYKFYLCFENVAWPGNVTEKIIHCFVSGVIPIYHGAPDHENYLPTSAYIDGSTFKKPEDLMLFFKSTNNDDSESHFQKMIKAGQDWLFSEAGQEHSFDGFAKRVITLIKDLK